jgi:signal transduction histidine kinase
VRNAVRQGQARHVGIELDADGRTLKLSIHHDGIGPDEEAIRDAAERPADGGLISMEERVRLAGGRLKTRTVAGAGTVLSAFFPLAEAAHA